MWGHFCPSLIQSISIYWALVLCQPYSRYRDTRREGDNVSNPVLVLCLQYSCPSTSLGSASVDSPNLRSKIFWEKKIMGNSIKQNLNSWVPGKYLHSIRYYKWSRDAFYNTVDLWTTSLNCKGPFVCGFFFFSKTSTVNIVVPHDLQLVEFGRWRTTLWRNGDMKEPHRRRAFYKLYPNFQTWQSLSTPKAHIVKGSTEYGRKFIDYRKIQPHFI